MKNRFHLKIELDLHAITCPGVWLCTSGSIELTIKSLGYLFKTGPMEPKFPVLCHEQFVMEGYFKSVHCISELNRILEAENIQISLWQSGRRLSYFNGKLADIIRSPLPHSTCFHNINVQILMNPSNCFPGIIAPKLEISSRAVILNQNFNQPESTIRNTHIVPLITRNLSRNYHQSSHEHFKNSTGGPNQVRRQRPVCHIRKETPELSRQRWKYDKSTSPNSYQQRESNSSCPSVTDFERANFNESRSSTCLSTSSGDNSNSDFLPGIGMNSFCDCHQHSEHPKFCHICESYRKTFFPSI